MKAIIATTLFGVIMMFAGTLVNNKKTVTALASVLFLALFGVNIYELMSPETHAIAIPWLNDALSFSDNRSFMFNAAMTGCTLLYVLLMGKEIQKVGSHVAEYFSLIFFILCGLYILSTYNTLLMLFLGIEIMSIPQYILAGSDKRNLKSSEASLKYFLMGAFSTGILLMGITLYYGATRSFNINAEMFQGGVNPLGLAGIMFIIVALGFKVSAAPMHAWTPDVYDGAPTPFTAFMATIVKAGAFFAFLRLFGNNTFQAIHQHWLMIIAVITAATLLVGNITAVFQQSVKRMLAYSSIAQAGFMLFVLLSQTKSANGQIIYQPTNGLILYAVAYSVATIGIFAVLVKLKDYTYDGFNGLAKKNPLLAFVTTIFIFSLAGIPLTGGFMAKYYMIYGIIGRPELLWLVIFALLMAAVSIYYYFRVITAMYFKTGDPELSSEITLTDKILLTGTCCLVVLAGILPQLFMYN